MRHALHRLDARKWFDRINCHGSTKCCQYVDEPMCNPPGHIPFRERMRMLYKGER